MMKIICNSLMCLLMTLCASPLFNIIQASESEVRIVRDTFGVPHIYADDTYSLFYGYGYAVGQDRLFQMEMTKRTTSGRVAEVMGKEYLALDKVVRQGFEPSSLHQQIKQLNAEQLAIFEGYAAGINAWIDQVYKTPKTLMPKEFIDFNFKPSHWTAYDVVLVFAGTMAHRYSDFNTEIDNLAFYKELRENQGEKAWDIFNSTLPIYDINSPATVPDSDAIKRDNKYQGKHAPEFLKQLASASIRPVAANIFKLDGGLLNITDQDAKQAYIAKHLSNSGFSGRSGFSSASNVWLVNGKKAKDAKGILVNGPQFGWINPSYVYGVGLHGAGYDVVGNTLLAYPFMLFAHNKNISWGSTAGFGDQVDIFVNKLNPSNVEEYFYKGKYLKLEKRTDSINVYKGDAVKETFYRTVHGPVILYDKEQGLVYSKKRSWEGNEVETGLAWVELAKSKNYNEWRSYLSKMSTNINFYFLDKEGNIGYTLSGKYPNRVADHDNRFPANGDGSMDWLGYIPFEKNPQVYNPKQNYIVNWNNRPERGWPNADMWFRRWGTADRADVLMNELTAKDSFSADDLWDINSRSSFADVNVAYLLPYLKKALAEKELSIVARDSLQTLLQWDGYWWDKNNDGLYDNPATTIMDTWLTTLLSTVLKDDVGEKHFYRFASPGYPSESIMAGMSVSSGIKIIIDMLTESTGSYDFFNGIAADKIFYESFVKAIEQLVAEDGHDIRLWLRKPAPLLFRTFNFRGAPQTSSENQLSLDIIMNRGSENNLFVADGEKILGQDVVAPGQSGFIAPDGTKAKHYSDQMEIYNQFKSKKLPFTKQQVQSMKESEIVIKVK